MSRSCGGNDELEQGERRDRHSNVSQAAATVLFRPAMASMQWGATPLHDARSRRLEK